MKGQITIKRTGSNGTILGDDGKQYDFNREELNAGYFPSLNDVVYFTPNGDRAKNVNKTGQGIEETTKPTVDKTDTIVKSEIGDSLESVSSDSSMAQPFLPEEYRFLNPYNFVRFLEKKRPQNHVLGDAPPPPHDRFVGLSGKIQCSVEAVSPLFVSDSEGIEETEIDGKIHMSYRFFQIPGPNDKLIPALPGSSLRGMLRSIFEIVTNSCISVFDGSKVLQYRKPTQYAQRLNAGIIKKIPTEGAIGEVVICNYAKVGAYYKGKNSVRNKLPKGTKCGATVWAKVTKGSNRRAWQVTTNEADIIGVDEDHEKIKGFLKITGENIERKANEYLFYDPASQGNLGTATFDMAVMNEYNVVLAEQISGPEPRVKMVQNKKLSVGDLVWVEKSGTKIVRIANVRIPRVQYSAPIGKQLGKFTHLDRCNEYTNLCPTCRTFGWVYQPSNNDGIPEHKLTAYSGRLRISNAYLTHNSGSYPCINLAILSSPKPTTTQFYLLDVEGKPDPIVNYNDNARLRGRKVYRHFGDWTKEGFSPDDQIRLVREFEQAKKDGLPILSDQNRTIRGALRPGAKFSFTLEYENLAPLELGALLFTLRLEDGMVHRLGYGKPLGFGSVRLHIDKLCDLDWEARLESLETNADRSDWTEKVEIFTEKFLVFMHSYYKEDYENILLADLRALLNEPPASAPIHYPRPQKDPHPDGKQFEWFVGNKKRVEKRGQSELDDPVTLGIAAEEVSNKEKWLPLIRKDGSSPES